MPGLACRGHEEDHGCHIPAPWIDAGTWYVKRKIIVPARGNTYTFHVETYHHRNWLLTLDGKPIRR